MTALQDVQPAPQHMVALEQANKVRTARAQLKRDIRNGAVSVIEVLTVVPWEAESMLLGDLLTSQLRWGVTRMRRLCRAVAIAETKQVGALTSRQRENVIRALGGNVAPEETPRFRLKRIDVPGARVKQPASVQQIVNRRARDRGFDAEGVVVTDPTDYLQQEL